MNNSRNLSVIQDNHLKMDKGYSILVPEGGGMENFADPPPIFLIFAGPPGHIFYFSVSILPSSGSKMEYME